MLVVCSAEIIRDRKKSHWYFTNGRTMCIYFLDITMNSNRRGWTFMSHETTFNTFITSLTHIPPCTLVCFLSQSLLRCWISWLMFRHYRQWWTQQAISTGCQHWFSTNECCVQRETTHSAMHQHLFYAPNGLSNCSAWPVSTDDSALLLITYSFRSAEFSYSIGNID